MIELRGPRGLYFEDFAPAQTFTSAARTVTEADVVNFAGISGDFNPIHTDVEYAKAHLLGQRVAHGLLGLSIAVGLTVRLGFLEGTMLAFREIGDWKFSQPIFIGDTIHVRLTVKETKPVARLGGGMITLEVDLLNQDDKIVQHGTWSALIKGRGSS